GRNRRKQQSCDIVLPNVQDARLLSTATVCRRRCMGAKGGKRNGGLRTGSGFACFSDVVLEVRPEGRCTSSARGRQQIGASQSIRGRQERFELGMVWVDLCQDLIRRGRSADEVQPGARRIE